MLASPMGVGGACQRSKSTRHLVTPIHHYALSYQLFSDAPIHHHHHAAGQAKSHSEGGHLVFIAAAHESLLSHPSILVYCMHVLYTWDPFECTALINIMSKRKALM